MQRIDRLRPAQLPWARDFPLIFIACAVTLAGGIATWRVTSGRILAALAHSSGRELTLASTALILVATLSSLWALFRAPNPRTRQGRLAAEPVRLEDIGTLDGLPVPCYRALEDGNGSVSYLSPELLDLLGYEDMDAAIKADAWSLRVHEEDRARVYAHRRQLLQPGTRTRSEYRLCPREGKLVWVRDESVVVDVPDMTKWRNGAVIDITDHKATEDALEHQALHDTLTDLPNRTLLLDRLQQALLAARRGGQTLALVLIDLDRFKDVNDTFGHHYGDLLLRQVVRHLRRVLRESDTVARLGGDEFAILLPEVDRSGVAAAAKKLLAVLDGPFEADGHSLDVGASIGIAVHPEHGHDANALLQRADIAMYRAKGAGLGFAIYDPQRDPHSPDRLELIRELKRSIDEDELVLHYQPKAELKTGCTEHFEALVRWQHPRRGLMAPDEFLALAEHAGLIMPLSLWVLDAALRQVHDWQSVGLDISVAVNFSARTLHDGQLADSVERLLARWKVPARCLEVEITESALVEEPAGALNTLGRLSALGICISIDDFGTGYSSLSYLTRLPAHQIKIDRSFVTDMARNDESACIVRSVIDLGHNLSLEVVAEGVEDQVTWDMLTEMGCDVAQGFHLSRPLTAAEVLPWLEKPQPCLSFAS